MNTTVRPLILLVLVHLTTAFVVNQPIQASMPTSPWTMKQNGALSFNNSKKSSRTSQSLVPDTTCFLLAEQSSLSLENKDVWIFMAGLFPFAWATIEFWRRIAVGQPFGTGKDSVYIGQDNAPSESRGRRVLDKGAFLVAYLLFGIAAAAIAITLFSVVTSPPMMDISSSSSLTLPL